MINLSIGLVKNGIPPGPLELPADAVCDATTVELLITADSKKIKKPAKAGWKNILDSYTLSAAILAPSTLSELSAAGSNKVAVVPSAVLAILNSPWFNSVKRLTR